MSAGKPDTPSQFGELAGFGTRMLKQTNKPRKEILRQLTEALRTGGVGARIPVVQRAVEQSQAATSQALKGASGEMAKYGVSGPYAAGTMAGIRAGGAERAARIPVVDTQNFIAQMVPFLATTQSLGSQNMAAGAQGIAQAEQFNALQFKALMQDIKDSTQSMSSMAGCLPEGTLIQTPAGWRAIDTLQLGDAVFSRTEAGDVVVGTVTETSRVPVPATHEFVAITVGPGLTVLVSPIHPIAGHRAVEFTEGALIPTFGMVFDRVASAERTTKRGIKATRDIAVDSATGEYLVWPGVWMQSTLDARHEVA